MISNIQLLRAIAAIAVVFDHALNNFVKYGHTIPFEFGIGAAGVDIFFLISGFIMVHIAQQRRQTPVGFWRDRVIRIVPLYWLATFVVLAATAVGTIAFGVKPSGLRDWDWGDLATSLLLVADIRADGNPWPILGVGWTLVYEAFFYMIFGMTLLLRDLKMGLVLLTLLMVALTIVGAFLTDVPYFISAYTQPIILEFCVGCILGFFYMRTDIFKFRAPRSAAIPLILLALFIMLLGNKLYPSLGEFTNLPRVLFFGAPAAMIVISALIMEKSGAVFRGRNLLLQGNASYATYLFHLLVLAVFYLLVSKVVSLQPLPIALAVLLLAIIVCCAGGTLIHLIVEKPLLGYFRGRSTPWSVLDGRSANALRHMEQRLPEQMR